MGGLRRQPAPSWWAAPASSAPTWCAPCSTRASPRSWWSTTCSRPSARTCPTTTGSPSSRARSPTTRCSPGCPTDRDFVWHLSTFHGNQSSIEFPLDDHENNLLTTLKLYERLKDFDGITKVVYSSSGGTVAPKTFDDATATAEDQPVSMHLDSPYQISKIVGRVLFELLLRPARPAGLDGPLPERLRPRRGAGRRALAGVEHGLAERHPDLRLQGAEGRDDAGAERRRRHPRLHLRRGHRPRPDGHGPPRRAGRRLQHGERHRDDDPRVGRDDRRARRRRRDRAGARPASGTTRASASAIRRRRARCSDSRPRCPLRDGPRAHGRLDAREPGLHRSLHRAPPRGRSRRSRPRRPPPDAGAEGAHHRRRGLHRLAPDATRC